MSKYVQHDGFRWRVAGEHLLDDDPAYELVRRTPRSPSPFARCYARVSDCQPDAHEPVRVLRDSEAVLRFNVKRKTVTLSEPRSRRKIVTSLGGILAMALRQQAQNRKRDKEFNRRTRRKG